MDPDRARVFVLIHAPDAKPRSTGTGPSSGRSLSVTSSYYNIRPEEAATPTDTTETTDLATVEPSPVLDRFESSSPIFKTLYNQAQTLVDKETMIMPFNSPNGHVHMIRHLSPDIVYMQESLAGPEGDAAHHISGWVRQIVIVIGDEGGRGLADSDDESALGENREKWWQKEGVTGLGKRIDVVDGLRTGEDWRRRVSGYD